MSNIIALLKNETQKKLINCAKNAKLSPDVLLNILIDDEIERQRLSEICNEVKLEIQEKEAPSQKLIKICNQYLAHIDHESESLDIRSAIARLYDELLDKNLLSVNSREGCVVEGKRIKTSRVDYYWYSCTLSKCISMCFGTEKIYLYDELLHPVSEIVFIGMPNNVIVTSQIFTHLYKILKKTKAVYKKDTGNWGTKREVEEDVGRYMSNFTQELQYIDAYIENENYSKHLFDYIRGKYLWTMR
jgi:hypothetical protein